MAIEFMKPPPVEPAPLGTWATGALDGLSGREAWLLAALVVGAGLIAFKLFVRRRACGGAVLRSVGGDDAGAPSPWGPAAPSSPKRADAPKPRFARAAGGIFVPKKGATCRWRLDKRRARGLALKRWVCGSCGVEACSADGAPPKECKRALRGARL